MKNSLTSLQQIVNPTKFQKIQDDISLATGLAIITVDYMGIPLTTHSNCNKFCQIMRSSEKYHTYCEKCDSRGGVEAARIRKPFIYFCHAGIVDFAIPIIVDNLYLGAFMAGQVLLDQYDSENKLEYILSGLGNAIDLELDAETREYYSMLPSMNLEKIIALANMLLHFGNYCIEVGILKDSVAQLSSRKASTESHTIPEHPINTEHSWTDTLAGNCSKNSSRILQPAFDYIKQYANEKITLSKMATLCNISTSYFSKLFARENRGSLSDYVNQIRIDNAKELLNKTDWPIRSIAENSGYDDSGYFIKVFKHHTGKTPAEFRNCHSTTSKFRP